MEPPTAGADALSPLLTLPPGLAHHVLRHLTKRDVQQFAGCCRHAGACALAAVRSLTLTHKCLSSAKGDRLRTMKACHTVTLRPRTMDELSKMATLLLVHNSTTHHLPALMELRIELLNVYDKQCDVSLILKSVVLHMAQLTQLSVEQEGQATAKAMAAMAELPLLTHLSVRTRQGFEPGALGQLARAVNLISLHVEVLGGASSNSASSRAPPTPTASSVLASPQGGSLISSSRSPSKLARLQASDEVGLGRLGGQLVAFATLGLPSSAARSVTALLACVAGSHKPRLAQLQLGGLHISSATVDLIAAISSLSTLLLLAGCELSGSPMDLARLSALTGLTQLEVAVPVPGPVLAAWTKGCKMLASLTLCAQPGPQPVAPPMTGVTQLVLLSHSAAQARASLRSSSSGCGGGGSTAGGSTSSSGGGVRGGFANLSITMRSPLSLSGLELLWPKVVSLEVAGWALDTGSVAALKRLKCLTALTLQGGRESGTALHARLLLPLLDVPNKLTKLALLELTDLSDEWLGEALRCVTAPAGSAGGGSSTPAAGIRELQLGAAAEVAASAGGSDGSGSGGAGSGEGASRGLLSDRGVARLVAWPQLTRLSLHQLTGLTLAGVKALVAGSTSLVELSVLGCPVVSAAPADSTAKAAVASPECAVDLWVR